MPSNDQEHSENGYIKVLLLLDWLRSNLREEEIFQAR